MVEQVGYMEDELISVAEAAKALGRNKQSLFKLINRLKLEKVFIKSEDARGQTAAFISIEDFYILKAHVEGASSTSESQENDATTSGYFYIIQLEPELDPRRLKLGFAASVDGRIRKHKTSAPFSKVLASWPCKLLWEKTVIDCLTENCERVYTEVFRVQDVGKTIQTAAAFFELMPKPFPDRE